MVVLIIVKSIGCLYISKFIWCVEHLRVDKYIYQHDRFDVLYVIALSWLREMFCLGVFYKMPLSHAQKIVGTIYLYTIKKEVNEQWIF